MNNTEEAKFLTEYETINQWRNNIVSSDYTMTYIFVTLAVGIFSTYFIIEEPPSFVRLVYLLISAGLIIFWRLYAYHIDKSVLNTYLRICELEEKFNFGFTREYLKSVWWSEGEKDKSWLPSRTELEEKLNSLTSWQKFRTRGHDKLNDFAILIIGVEALVVCIDYLWHIQPK